MPKISSVGTNFAPSFVSCGPLFVCTVNQMLGLHYEGYPTVQRTTTFLPQEFAVAPVKTRAYNSRSYMHTLNQGRFQGWLNHLPMQGTGVNRLFLLQNELSTGIEFSRNYGYRFEEVITGVKSGFVMLNNQTYGEFSDGSRFFRFRRPEPIARGEDVYLDFVVVMFPDGVREPDERRLFERAHITVQSITSKSFHTIDPFPVPEMEIRLMSPFLDFVGASVLTQQNPFVFQDVYQGIEIILKKNRALGLTINGFALVIGSEYNRRSAAQVPPLSQVTLGGKRLPQMQLLLIITERDTHVTSSKSETGSLLPAVFQVSNFTELHAIVNI